MIYFLKCCNYHTNMKICLLFTTEKRKVESFVASANISRCINRTSYAYNKVLARDGPEPVILFSQICFSFFLFFGRMILVLFGYINVLPFRFGKSFCQSTFVF
jgi:hypothetical protein